MFVCVCVCACDWPVETTCGCCLKPMNILLKCVGRLVSLTSRLRTTWHDYPWVRQKSLNHLRVLSLRCPKASLKCITHNLSSPVQDTRLTEYFRRWQKKNNTGSVKESRSNREIKNEKREDKEGDEVKINGRDVISPLQLSFISADEGKNKIKGKRKEMDELGGKEKHILDIQKESKKNLHKGKTNVCSCKHSKIRWQIIR